MSILKIQLVIFVLFGFFLKSQGLEILKKDKRYLILVTKSAIRNITDELFKKLNFNSEKFDAKLNQILIVHNYYEDDKTLNEIVKLSRADKSFIKKETENVMVLLNDILNEDFNTTNHESNGSNGNQTIQDFDKYLVDLYDNSNNSLKDNYNNLHIKNELINIIISDYTNSNNGSRKYDKPAEISEKVISNYNNDEYWGNQLPESRRIYKGERAFIKDFPFMASIHILNSFQCGGSIIKSDLVITACSCLQMAWNNRSYSDNPILLSVRVGSNHINSGGRSIPIVEVYFHPEYNPKNLRNNIAVLRLKEKLIFKNNKKLKKIDIDRSARPLTTVVDGITVVGWGAKEASRIPHNTWSDQVNYAVLEVYNLKDCTKVYSSEYVTKKNFCAGFSSKGSGACNHDVGGPGIANGVLAGIMSFGSPVCGTPDAPTVFEKVGSHADWIQKIMKLDISVIEKQVDLQLPIVEYDTPGSDSIVKTFKTPKLAYPSAEKETQLTYDEVQSEKRDYNDIQAVKGYTTLDIVSPSEFQNLENKALNVYNKKPKMNLHSILKQFPQKNHVKEKKSIRPIPIGRFKGPTYPTDPMVIKGNKYTVTENYLPIKYDDESLQAMIVKLIEDMNNNNKESQRYNKKNNKGDKKAKLYQSATKNKEKGGTRIGDDVLTLLYISDDEKNNITFDDINDIFKDLDDNLGAEEIFSSGSFKDMTFKSDINGAVMDLFAEDLLSLAEES